MARFWAKKVLVCASCLELAEKAESELDVAFARAKAHALLQLEQRVLSGKLLELPGLMLPGVGEADVA
jgi:hypothetical protein